MQHLWQRWDSNPRLRRDSIALVQQYIDFLSKLQSNIYVKFADCWSFCVRVTQSWPICVSVREMGSRCQWRTAPNCARAANSIPSRGQSGKPRTPWNCYQRRSRNTSGKFAFIILWSSSCFSPQHETIPFFQLPQPSSPSQSGPPPSAAPLGPMRPAWTLDRRGRRSGRRKWSGGESERPGGQVAVQANPIKYA